MKALSTLSRTVLLVLFVVCLSPSGGRAQQSVTPKHVLVLYWDEKDYPANIEFERYFQAALRSSAPGPVEFYSESLESSRFPGEDQSRFLRDYIRQKYAGRPIDAVVPTASPPLEFLLKYRSDLFPGVPIVFGATTYPSAAQLEAGAGATGIVFVNTYRKTLDLALKLHPGTEHVFIVSGTMPHDHVYETLARSQLNGYESNAAITYLTDLPVEKLMVRIKTLPERSIVLYVWQQARNIQGRLLESRDILKLIVPVARVPLYGMSFAHVGSGIVGGYVYTMEANTARLAEMTLKVTSGTQASNIPVESAPDTPMFDWRQLQRWGVREDSLPENSVVRFRELSLWQRFKWRILAAVAIVVLQSLLIVALLVARKRARRTRWELEKYKESLELLVEKRTAELVQARDQAQAGNKAKSAFLANMSHELRTPLNAILGFSNLLRQHGATEEQRRDLDIINRSGEHLLSLINDVLDLAKIDAGGAVVKIVPCDLKALLQEVVGMIRPRAQEKLLVLQLVESPESPRYIRTDAARLRQVLINLLGNSVKYTDEGSVTLRSTSRSTEDENHARLIFEVEDTGIGIAVEDQARVFEPFVQLAGARMQKGTGLGLAITRQFIELMGGTIRIQSTPGKGSSFCVELPVEQTRESEDKVLRAEPAQVAVVAAGSPEYRVLVVEDERENQKLLKYLLQRAGFRVRIAHDGAEGVECFREWQPHFIWMDLRMPVMSGFDATRSIRALEGGRKVRIAAVTASGFDEERNEALAAGMDDYVRKPYRPSEIYECMARQLGVRYQRKAVPEAPELAAELRTEDLARLPQELRAGLREALLTLDGERISAAIGRVSQENAPLSSALALCASRYAYTAMLNAINLDTERSPEGHSGH